MGGFTVSINTHYSGSDSLSHKTPNQVFDNGSVILTILNSQREGISCLPYQLGLSKTNYDALCDFFKLSRSTTLLKQTLPEDDLRQELLNLRTDEWQDLRNLLVSNRNQSSPTEVWVAEIVAAGCMGGDHLWRDLGLPNRAMLRTLLEENFAKLAKKNTQDMKWKKYFYKQLCEQEGGYVCRAPSCEQCAVYDNCFGPED